MEVDLEAIDGAIKQLREMTMEERVEVFSHFCTWCGANIDNDRMSCICPPRWVDEG